MAIEMRRVAAPVEANPSMAATPAVETPMSAIVQQIQGLRETLQMDAAQFARPANRPWSWKACDAYRADIDRRISKIKDRIHGDAPEDEVSELLKTAKYTADIAIATKALAYIRTTLEDPLAALQHIDSTYRVLAGAKELSEGVIAEFKAQILSHLTKVNKVLTETAIRIKADKIRISIYAAEDLEVNMCTHVRALVIKLQEDGILEVGPEYYPRFFFTCFHIRYVYLHLRDGLIKAGVLDIDALFIVLQALPEQFRRNILFEATALLQREDAAAITNEKAIEAVLRIFGYRVYGDGGTDKTGVFANQCPPYLVTPVENLSADAENPVAPPAANSAWFAQRIRQMIIDAAASRAASAPLPPEEVEGRLSVASAFGVDEERQVEEGAAPEINRELPPLNVDEGAAMRHMGVTASGEELAALLTHTGDTPTPSHGPHSHAF